LTLKIILAINKYPTPEGPVENSTGHGIISDAGRYYLEEIDIAGPLSLSQRQ
jgi:hypothetical protein